MDITKRMDETYVITHNGLPYHVVPGDPLHAQVEMEIEAGATWEWEQPPAEPTEAEVAARVRAERDQRIAAIMWRVQRYESEVRQALTPTDDIVALDAYVQALRDVPQQVGFPEEVEWPIAPESM